MAVLLERGQHPLRGPRPGALDHRLAELLDDELRTAVQRPADGRHDRVVPAANAEILTEHIPDAELRILDQAGHLYSTEQPEVDQAGNEAEFDRLAVVLVQTLHLIDDLNAGAAGGESTAVTAAGAARPSNPSEGTTPWPAWDFCTSEPC